MAVVDGPLFGEQAWGRIKDVLVYCRRYGWDRCNGLILSSRGTKGGQVAWRAKWAAGVLEWNGFTVGEKAAYDAEAGELTTGFNAWMHRYMLDLGPI